MRQTMVRRAWVAGVVASVGGWGVARAEAPPAAGDAATTQPAASLGAATGTGAGVAGADAVPANTAPAATADAAKPANLMSLFGLVGVRPTLDNLGLGVYGHVEGGYTYQFLQPNDTLAGRRYDFISNRVLLDQAAINFERKIKVATDHFDVGFRVQAMEGTDAGFTESFQSFNPAKGESNALFDVGGNHSAYQFDLPDAYLDIGLPIGRGVRVRVGRFEFFKPIDPNDRLFYSTTFVYTNALPFTNTGVTAAYDFSDGTGIEAGFSRGYNVTVNDFNRAVDFIGKGRVKVSDRASLVGTLDVGPELARDSRDYTVLVDLAGSYRLARDVSLSGDGIYAHQFGSSNTSLAYNPFNAPTGHLPASYYGVSGNLVWQVNAYVSLGGRVEWFHDDGGLLSGANRSLYEATIGSTVKPFPRHPIGRNLKIRPEVRFDYSNRDFFGLDPFGQPTRKQQLTFGTDVIYNF